MSHFGSDELTPLSLPWTFKELQRWLGGAGPEMNLMSVLSRNYMVFNFFEMFTLPAELSVSHSNAGTDFVGVAGQGGVVAGITDVAQNDTISMYGLADFEGDHECGILVRFKSDKATAIQAEIGFTDVATTKSTSVVNDIDTPSIQNGATNVALVAIDTSKTQNKFCLVTDGSTAGQNTTATMLTSPSTGESVPAASTYRTVMVQFKGYQTQAAIFDENGALLASAANGAAAASRVTETVALLPWILFKTKLAQALTVTVDKVAWWQHTNVLPG